MSLKFTPKKEEELSRFQNLPDGVYPFTVMESEIQTSKSAKNFGKEMVKVKLNVHGPEYDRHVYDYFADWFSEWKLKHFCDTTGMDEDYDAGEVDPSRNAWFEKTGYVIISTESDPKYGEKNVVFDYSDSNGKNDVNETPAPSAKPQSAKPAPAKKTVEAENDDVPF